MHAYAAAALLSFAVSVLAADTCYLRIDDQIRIKNGWFACSSTEKTPSGAKLCCQDGDQCGPDMICRTPSPKEGNEWYVGGCTDKTYKDPVCAKDCSTYKQTWIDYNSTKQDYWACCGDYDCADGPSTSTKFQAVSPEEWKLIPQSGGTNGGLSLYAKIGIGIGAAVLVAAIIGIGVCVCLRRRKRTRKAPAFGGAGKKKYEQVHGGGDVQMQVPFVPAENQPYSRPSSPMPNYRDRSASNVGTPPTLYAPHQPPPSSDGA